MMMTYRAIFEYEPSEHGGAEACASSDEKPPPVRIVFEDVNVHAK
jgi:hypothetical protein